MVQDHAAAPKTDVFQEIADAAPVMLWRINASFDITWANETWFELTGGSLEAEDNFAWIDKVHPDDRERVVEEFDCAFSERRPVTTEFRIMGRDGAYHWLIDKGQPVFKDGAFDGFVGSCFDITERKEGEVRAEQLQLEIVRLSRAEAVSSLATMVVHELGQPLQAVASYAGGLQALVGARDFKAEEIRGAVEGLKLAIDRATEIVHNCRKLAAGQPSDRSLIDLAVVIAGIEPLIRASSTAAASAVIEWDLEPDLVVEANPVQIEQVMMNLVTNAIEAVDGLSRLKIAAGAWGRSAIVTVTDWGQGVAPELKERVLVEPVSNKRGGMGVGLYISRSIVSAHGGRSWVEDNPEGGAVFKFTLPLAG